MAELSESQRAEVSAGFQRDVSRVREELGALTKAQLRAAVDAVDTWVDDNAVSFNNAFPSPAKAELTNQQKVRILWYVVERRFQTGEP